MEEKIKQSVKKLRFEYILFWIVPVLLIAAFEIDLFPVGVYADNQGIRYGWETASILLTVLVVPVSLKYFNVILKKKIDHLSIPDALNQYVTWSSIRLLAFAITALFNLVVYYLTLGNIGSLCALIAFTASVFCIPGEKRLRDDLNIIPE